MQYTKHKRAALDLIELHAICEANYARLMRLFPAYETANRREFVVGGAAVTIEVVDRSRYTTIFRLHQLHGGERWLGQLRMELRAYHDAAMLEVGSFQSHRRVQPRYRYPNPQMHQQDEKSQQNRFLADWLENCLAHGRGAIPADSRA